MRFNVGLASMVGPLRMVVGVSVGGGKRVSQAVKQRQVAISKRNLTPRPPLQCFGEGELMQRVKLKSCEKVNDEIARIIFFSDGKS
jgi:hypothetical protein